MKPVLVRSRRMVLPDGVRPAAIRVEAGRIAAVLDYDPALRSPAGELDAGDLVVMPGVVDTHVHVNEPGRTDWEGFDHATRAAAAGGVTTIVDMPLNSMPPTVDVEGLEAKLEASRGQCHVDVGFWGGVVPGNTRHLAPLARAGVRGFKAFLSPSGVGEFPHVGERDLREALPVLANLGRPLLVHAELPGLLRDPGVGRSPRAYRTWLETRPATSERAAADLLIGLSREYGAPVPIVHVSSPETAATIRRARDGGVAVTGETCPHYLTFCDADIPDGATAFKCAPPIRSAGDRDGLWTALAAGDIDLVASDHSPAPPAMKHLDDGDFLQAWGGIASLQIGLPAVWTGASARGLDLARLSRWMCDAPSRLAGLDGSKGTIAVGKDADLVIWDPDADHAIDPRLLHHRHPATPYAGMRLRGQVRTTILRGEVIFADGAVTARTGRFVLR